MKGQPQKSGFTLIELLVVIAIIAVLAAILFPVFARAKEAAQKSTSLSNLKQLSASTEIYMGDNDGLFPLSYSLDGFNRLNIGEYSAYPHGWHPVIYPTNSTMMWANSVGAYHRSPQLLEAPGAPFVKLPQVFGANAYSNPIKPPASAAMTQNGLLHGYPQSAVSDPSRLVQYWYGYGRENLVGTVIAQPALNCGIGVTDCRFNPGGMPSTQPYPGTSSGQGDTFWFGYTPANESVWFYGKGQNMVRVDGSAKFYHLGAAPGTTKNSHDDPYRAYGNRGDLWLQVHRCSSGGSPITYSSFFRPDNEFRSEFGSGPSIKCLP